VVKVDLVSRNDNGTETFEKEERMKKRLNLNSVSENFSSCGTSGGRKLRRKSKPCCFCHLISCI